MTMVINNEPWFVGKDVVSVLGYLNPQKAIRDHVDDEDRLGERIVLSGQNRMTIFINESGLYALILSSKLPQAKEYKRWVTSEVLGYSQTAKAIREHVDDEDKLNNISLSSLEQRGGWLINESSLSSLILSSKLLLAREFKRRVTSEVLGQIRKMSGYIPINGCELVLWFYSSIFFRDTHTIRIVR